LISAAPDPTRPVSGTGRVLDSGTAGRGSYRHVLVSVHAPSWLVLGEGYDRGWRASCNGRSLGAPVPIDGYANGWAVSAGCRTVSFTFAPDRLAEGGYVVSGVAGLVCVLMLVVGGWRARRRRRGGPPRAVSATRPWLPGHDRPPAPWSPVRALVWSLVAGAIFAFTFGLVPGAVAVPVLAFMLWRGVGPRTLTLVAGGLLAVVVPVLYLAHPGDERGGDHFGYASAHLAAHYVGVAALGLLAVALWRSLRVAPRGPDQLPVGPEGAPPATGAAEPSSSK
jgi:arabinofuranan 3-O-arabinosyltransferase